MHLLQQVFYQNLSLPYFKKAEFSSPTFRDTRMNADRFNIKMEIEGVKEIQKEKGDDEEE